MIVIFCLKKEKKTFSVLLPIRLMYVQVHRVRVKRRKMCIKVYSSTHEPIFSYLSSLTTIINKRRKKERKKVVESPQCLVLTVCFVNFTLKVYNKEYII
jgi:hypothetical protein